MRKLLTKNVTAEELPELISDMHQQTEESYLVSSRKIEINQLLDTL